MIRLALLVSVVAVATHVVSAVDYGATLALTLSCGTDAACTGTYELPQLDPGNTIPYSLAAGQKKTLQIELCGPCKAQARALKTLKVTLTENGESMTVSVALAQKSATSTGGTGGGVNGQHNGNDGPHISAGPMTRYQVVHDKRGDNHSAFDYPVNWDIVSASAKRSGTAIVFSVTTVQPIALHDGYGNWVTPCVEIPFGSRTHTSEELFGSGNIAGSGNPGQAWPKIPMTVRGNTVTWTVPKRFLFTLGFQWRAIAGCDLHHPADFAPDRGFETFRWATVK